MTFWSSRQSPAVFVFMDYKLVTNQSQLEEVCQRARQHDAVAIDTEFVRTRTLMPQLGLIQLYDSEQLVLIDPLAIDDFSSLIDLLSDQNVVKVLHSCSEDIETFLNAFSMVPSPIFDTQFAAAILGKGATLGYARLVEMQSGVTLDKGESRTDWLARPLSDKQCAYAANDVLYLLPVYHQLRDDIVAADKLNWVYEEMALLAKRKQAQVPAELAYLNLKNLWRLNQTQLTVLQALAKWRIERAREKDMALNHVFKEGNLFECASRLVQSKTAMAKIPTISPQELRFNGSKVASIITQTLIDIEQGQRPLVSTVKRLIDVSQYKSRFSELKQACQNVADENNVGIEVVASKKQINQVLKWTWFDADETRALGIEPDLLTGWRGPLLKSAFTEILAK